MPNPGEVYKCDLCGNMVMVLEGGGADLVCCGQDMTLQAENTVDAAVEKHVPVIEQDGDTVTVKVGEVDHPMVDKHYITWIELMVDGQGFWKALKPGEAPAATFCVKGLSGDLKARAYCNLHGLWASS